MVKFVIEETQKNPSIYTVGFWTPMGNFAPVKDHSNFHDAYMRLDHLNHNERMKSMAKTELGQKIFEFFRAVMRLKLSLTSLGDLWVAGQALNYIRNEIGTGTDREQYNKLKQAIDENLGSEIDTIIGTDATALIPVNLMTDWEFEAASDGLSVFIALTVAKFV